MAIEPRESTPGDPLDDRHLTALLASLPRERARTGFSSRVLARLAESPGKPRRPVWLATASAAATLAVLAGGGFALYRSREVRNEREIAAARRVLAEIRDEHRALSEDIEKLPGGREPRVLYLGGDDRTDYFVDLAHVDDSENAPTVPAALRNRS